MENENITDAPIDFRRAPDALARLRAIAADLERRESLTRDDRLILMAVRDTLRKHRG